MVWEQIVSLLFSPPPLNETKRQLLVIDISMGWIGSYGVGGGKKGV